MDLLIEDSADMLGEAALLIEKVLFREAIPPGDAAEARRPFGTGAWRVAVISAPERGFRR